MPSNTYTLKIGQTGAKKTGKALGGVNTSLGSMAKKIASVTAIFYAGKGLISGFTSATKKASDFQKGLGEIGTLLGKDVDQMGLYSKRLQSMSVGYGQSLDKLAKAQYDVISAGFGDIAKSQEVLTASAKLAIGGVSDIATASDLLTTTMNAMGLQGADTDDVIDKLFNTVKLGKTTISELGASFGTMLPFAKQAGMNLNTVSVATGITTASIGNTAESATALKALFGSLASPTIGVAKAMKEIGFQTIYAEDGSADLVATLKQFEVMDKETITKILPRKEAQLAVTILTDNIEGLEQGIKKYEKETGSAEKAFTSMTKTWDFQAKRFKGAWDTILVSMGNSIIQKFYPALEGMNDKLQEMTDIGWDNVGKAIMDNLSELQKPLEISAKALGEMVMSGFGSGFQSKGEKMLMGILGMFERLGENILISFLIISHEIRANFITPLAVMMDKGVQAIWNTFADLLTKIPNGWKIVISKIIGGLNMLIKTANKLPKIDIALIDEEKVTAPFDKAIEKIQGIKWTEDIDAKYAGFLEDSQAGIMKLHEYLKSDNADWQNDTQQSLEDANNAWTDYYNSIKEKAKANQKDSGDGTKDGGGTIPTPTDEIIAEPQKTWLQNWKDAYSEFSIATEENKVTTLDKIKEFNTNAQEIGGQFLSAWGGMTGAMSEETEARYQNELSNLQDSAKYRNADAEQRADMEKDLTKKFAKEKLKIWKMEKQAKIGQAMMGIADSIIGALGAKPWGLWNIGFAGMVGAMGLAQLNAIAKTKPPKFARGGMVGGNRHSSGGTMIEAESGEFVMNRNAVNRIGIGNLNAMNSGGGGTTINISAPMLDDTIADSIIPKIKEAVRRGENLGV